MKETDKITDLMLRNQEIIDELKLIQHLPDYKRIPAENRFLMIKEYEELLKIESEKFGEKFRRTPFLKDFCAIYGLNHKTFYKFMQREREGGIEALVTGWGKRKGKSNIAKIILPIVHQIMEPAKGYKHNLEKLMPICEQMGIEPPSYETFRNIAVANGLSEILTGKKRTPKPQTTEVKYEDAKEINNALEWVRITDRKGSNLAILKFDLILSLLKISMSGNEKNNLIDEIIKKKHHTLNEAVIRVSESSLYRYMKLIKKYGFAWLFGKQNNSVAERSKGTIRTILNINPNDPLQCLDNLKEIIETNSAISSDIKDVTLRFFKNCQRFTRLGVHKYRRLSLCRLLTNDEIRKLEKYKNGVNKNHKKRATAILMANQNCTLFEIMMEIGCTVPTIYKWIKKFKEKGIDFIRTTKDFTKNNEELRERPHRILRIVHHSPKDYGINRTAWIYRDIRKVYETKHGKKLSKATIRKVFKDKGYRWKSARRVLISQDPEYKEKTKKVLDTLQNLGPNDAFFFIDEAGPWQVKKYGGKSWTKKGEEKFYLQTQKPKGRVTFIGSLDAVRNQTTWFFIKSKNTAAVVCLIKILFFKYHNYSTLNLTWDCASWHKSKGLQKCLDELNGREFGPKINIVPLPKQAQNLNVIESVFSGVKSAVIFNSDYGSEYEMKMAIDRHFRERNGHYKANPKRAGNKIWDKEYYNLDHFESGLHKRR